MIDPHSIARKVGTGSPLAESCIRGVCYIDLHLLCHATHARHPKLIPIVSPAMDRMLLYPTSNPSKMLVEPMVCAVSSHDLDKIEKCSDTQNFRATRACKADGTVAYMV